MIASLAAFLGCLNILCIVLLTVDRWVHRVTGGKSLEARIKDLEDKQATTHTKANDVQKKIGSLDVKLVRIETHLENTDKNVERLERRT